MASVAARRDAVGRPVLGHSDARRFEERAICLLSMADRARLTPHAGMGFLKYGDKDPPFRSKFFWKIFSIFRPAKPPCGRSRHSRSLATHRASKSSSSTRNFIPLCLRAGFSGFTAGTIAVADSGVRYRAGIALGDQVAVAPDLAGGEPESVVVRPCEDHDGAGGLWR
jgi:hypothetical protein